MILKETRNWATAEIACVVPISLILLELDCLSYIKSYIARTIDCLVYIFVVDSMSLSLK